MNKIKKLLYVIIVLTLFPFLEIPNVIAQWIPQESGTSFNLWSIHFANDNTGFCVGDNGTIQKTTNGGNNWITMPSPVTINFHYVRMFGVNNIIIGNNNSNINNNIILKSTNSGNNWSVITVNIEPTYWGKVQQFFSFTHGFILTDLHYRTTNGGQNWSMTYMGGEDMSFINENIGWVCGKYWNPWPEPYGEWFVYIYKTTNGGVNWEWPALYFVQVNEYNTYKLFFVDSTMGFMSETTSSHIYLRRTTTGGSWWNNVVGTGTSKKYYSISFPSSDTGWFTGEQTIKSTDGGSNWTVIATPGGNMYRTVFFINNLTGWIAGFNGLIAKTTTGGVNIKPISNVIPKSFKLYQNYPNPFNPVTKIKFDIPKSNHVKIIIYNALGKEVATLVNEKLSAGGYEVDWNASGNPSGVYYYKLETEEFTKTRKIVLLK